MTISLRKLITLLSVCTLALGVVACGGADNGQSAEDVPADAIALVGDQPVPKGEFTGLMDRAEQGYEAQKREFPKVGSPEYQDLKTRAVQFLVERYQYRQEAQALGVEITDQEITDRLDEIKQQSFEGDDEKFQAELEKLGLTEEDAREEIRDRLVQEQIYDAVTKNVQVTDDQISEYYEANNDQFTQPRQVRHILVKKEGLAERISNQLEGGANFAKLAKQYSTDKGSAKQGGKLTATKGQTVPEFDKVAFELEKGEISQPVKTQFGYHIIQALEPVEVTPLEEAKDTIRQQLVDQKKKAAMDTWVAETKRKYANDVVYAVGFSPAATTSTTTTGQ